MENTNIYIYTFESEDEDGKVEEGLSEITEYYSELFDENWDVNNCNENLVSFLSQTDNDAYIDKWGMVHEVDKYGNNQVFAYIFEVHDNDWSEVTGNTGYWLDDENNHDMPESVRSAFSKVYNCALNQMEKNDIDIEK